MAPGCAPRALAATQMAPPPKPEGGARAIGLFPGPLRPFTRWTKDTASAQWATQHHRSYVFGTA
eukprot:5271810-Pyramimonas_sp.AAC.1